jgi:DMSO/TMAO reductase YedYZ molybdopterin-dependent catalytic subunit
LKEEVTPVADTFVTLHLGVPRIDPQQWQLDIGGLVEKPIRLNLADLRNLPFVRFESVHQCAGNPLEPHIPKRRVCNVIWTGVRLADLLHACQPRPEVQFVWAEGADYGTFFEDWNDAYVKDLTLQRALSSETLLAFEMNGEPLRPENGFPVRLVVPGYFGTNSVKWLRRITLADRRSDGLFVTRYYNDPDAGGGTRQDCRIPSISLRQTRNQKRETRDESASRDTRYVKRDK